MDIEFLKLKKSFSKKDYQINSSFFWKIALYIFFVLITLSFIYGFYLFIGINKEYTVFSVSKNDQIEKNRKKRIEKVLEYFSEREKKSNDILNFPSPVVDPSI